MRPFPALKLLLPVFLIFSLVGCGGGGGTGEGSGVNAGDESSGGTSSTTSAPNSDETMTVGFSQIGAESVWRTAETKSIRSEATIRGYALKFSDAQGKQENQIRAVRSFVAQDVDAVVLAPIVETGWEPVLLEAKRAGIPVILVDRGVTVPDTSLYTTLIASDFVREGRMAAEWLAEQTGGQARIVELKGTTGSAPAIDRAEGFHAVIDQHPGMSIIKSQDGEFERARGKELMEAFLKSEGDRIDAVYAHNDDMALGAVQAIKEAGLDPGEDILVVSIDGIKDAFEAIVAGDLNCTVECNPLLGPLVFDTLEDVIEGNDVPKRIVVNDRLFDRTNAAEFIDARAY